MLSISFSYLGNESSSRAKHFCAINPLLLDHEPAAPTMMLQDHLSVGEFQGVQIASRVFGFDALSLSY